MPTITKKKTKMIVKDGNGGLLQLLPETEVDAELDEESSSPVASSTVAEALSGIEDAASNTGAIKVMNEEPTALNTTECTGETLIAWVQSKVGWSITVDTEADGAGNKKTGIPFYLYGQDGITLTVDWGDGSTSTLTSADYAENDSTASVHEYTKAGKYTIKIDCSNWENTYLICRSSYITNYNQLNAKMAARYLFEKTLTIVNTSFPEIGGMKCYTSNTSSTIKNNTFDCCFYECNFLQFIPADLFANNTAVTSFEKCFWKCYSLQLIPPGLFDNNTAVTSFSGCFGGCTSLQSIPSGLFDKNTVVTSFYDCFYGCSSIQSIPAGLFDNNTAVTSFLSCFYGCISLQSIPAGLFDKNTRVTNFGYCFHNCTSLQSIPSGLFDKNTVVTDFKSCFYGCSSIQSIPSGLFDKNVKASDFWTCFSKCTSLQSIPEGLFDNNTAVTDFNGCFKNCTSLQSIPSGLFDKNTAVTDFQYCFADCSSLTDFTLHIGSSSVSNCSSFVTNKSGTTRTIYVPSGSTTQTKFNAVASSLGLTIIGE